MDTAVPALANSFAAGANHSAISISSPVLESSSSTTTPNCSFSVDTARTTDYPVVSSLDMILYKANSYRKKKQELVAFGDCCWGGDSTWVVQVFFGKRAASRLFGDSYCCGMSPVLTCVASACV